MFFLFPSRVLTILNHVVSIHNTVNIMSETLDLLAARVEAIETVADAAIALLAGLKSQLDEAVVNNDMGAIQILSERLAAQSDELAAAIVANTPAETPPAETTV